jgi:hypothetical protein
MAYDNIAESVKSDDLVSFSTLALYTPGVKTLQNGNEYVYVFNAAANSTIGTGKYCILDSGGGQSFTSGYSVTVTNASLAGWLFGVAQNTISTGTFGWVMVKGVSLVALDSGAASFNAGADLALGTDGGFVAAGATFATAPRFGFAINSGVTTVGTSKARIWGIG